MAPPSPGAGTPRSMSPMLLASDANRDSTKAASSRSHKIQLLHQQDANGPIPQVALHKFRFLVIVIFGVGLVGAGLGRLIDGLPIQTEVADFVGTSTVADSRVELFQVVNGFVWAAVGLLLEEYFKIFIAVMIIFFANHKWSPNDPVTQGPTKFKVATLFWFTPLMMYVINIGLSSVFIEHKATITVRTLVDEDMANPLLTVGPMATSNAERTSVVDTVLRSAVNGRVQPFVLNQTVSCASVDASKQDTASSSTVRTVSLPKISDMQSTAVAFGFTPRPWNLDAMPFSLTPIKAVTVANNIPTMEADLKSFLVEANVEYVTLMDMIIQGLTLHGKAVTDSNSFKSSKCDQDADPEEFAARKAGEVRRRYYRAPRRLQTSSSDGSSEVSSSSGTEPEEEETSAPPKAKRGAAECYSGGETVAGAQRVPDPAKQTAAILLESFSALGLKYSDASIEIETYRVSPLVNLTSMTIDLPFPDDEPYRYIDFDVCEDGEYIESKSKTERAKYATEEEFLAQQERDCSPNIVAFDSPFQQCGEKSCIIEDYSNVLQPNRQVAMTPFMINCDPADTDIDPDTFVWYPKGCKAQANSLFLYGIGTYFTGDVEMRGSELGPFIRNPRRHFKMTFTKVDYKFEDVNKRFDAVCKIKGEIGCRGMIHALQNVKDAKSKPRVAIVTESRVPTVHVNRTLLNPLPLVMLRDPKFYVRSKFTLYTTFEYMDFSRLNINWTQPTLGLGKGSCSLYADAFLRQVEKNHFYIQDPRQVVYAAAVFYLFQDAAVKEVVLPDGNKDNVVDLDQAIIGTTRLKGDQEKKQIRYSIPLPSVVSTAIGIVMILMFMGIIIKWPRDAVKLTDETNPAAQFADVLIDDLYPERVHTRRLRLMDNEIVEMDDYATKRIVFRNIHAPDMPVVME